MSFDAPLARLAADRHAERRAESGLIQSLLQRPSTRIVPVARGLVPTLHTDDAGPPRLAFLTPGEARLEGTELYLGSFGGIDYVGLVIEEDRPPALDGRPAATPDPSRPVLPALGEARWVSVREIEAQLSDLEVGLVMSATALAAWHARERFCPACGSTTSSVNAGWARRCDAEGTELFPRIDPAVIVAVTDPSDRLLLARAHHFAPHRFSVLAGYVDAGESLEAAVGREVAEEVGLELTQLAYMTSQAWPFPRSLMCAFEARAASGTLSVDSTELAEARWFDRPGLARAVDTGAVRLPPRSAIARTLIERWRGGPAGGLAGGPRAGSGPARPTGSSRAAGSRNRVPGDQSGAAGSRNQAAEPPAIPDAP